MSNAWGRWGLFLVCLILLGLSATPYVKIADRIAIGIRVAALVVLSILAVHAKISSEKGGSDRVRTFVQRCRRWYYGG